MAVKRVRRHRGLDIKDSIRQEVRYFGRFGDLKHNVYIFNCRGCQKEFHKLRYQLENSTGYCKPCLSKYLHAKPEEDRMEITCNKRNQIKKPEDFPKSSTKKRRVNTCKECINLYSFYKLNVNDYNKLLEENNYRCSICNIHIDEIKLNIKRKKLVVDHCHTTNKVRGILCPKCNMALGFFRDSKEILLGAIKYLEKFDSIKDEISSFK